MNNSTIDDWSASVASTSTMPNTRIASQRNKFPIKDDWEDSDEETDLSPNAVTILPQPDMPITPSSNSSPEQSFISSNSSSPFPMIPIPANTIPAAAFQPAIKILKRPSSTSNAPNLKKEMPREDIGEREAKYREARERIFGVRVGGGEGDADREKEKDVKRQPRGPDNADKKGFKIQSRTRISGDGNRDLLISTP